jgi:2',3'-cyclic-nucleotide 2'-phosphodiesterase (5'-nucleotidase family)
MKKNILFIILTFFIAISCTPKLYVNTAKTQNVNIGVGTGENTRIKDLIQPYKLQIDEAMNKVIGQTAKELRCERADLESPLGNFIVDLMLYQTSKIYDMPLDICVVNNGGLRVPINAGNVTVGNIFELMPFENEVVVLTLTGSDLLELLAYEAKYRKTSFANAKLKYTEEGLLISAMIGGEPLQATKTYKLVTYDYLANGGDGMTCFEKLKREPMGITVRTMIIDHIAELASKNQLADGNIEGRVVFRD